MEALYIAGSGLTAAERGLTVVAHNVANMQVAGFKRISAQFSELISRPAATDGSGNAQAPLTGLGTRVADNIIEFSPGALQPTGSPLDIAIQGDGFIEVELPNGEYALSRGGRLEVDADGRLALASGEVIGADIRVPEDASELKIETDGRVRARVGEASEYVELGQLMLSKVANPSAMRPLGNGLYMVTESSGEALAHAPSEIGGEFVQGFLEGANVDLVQQMAQLVVAQRTYQVNARIIQAADRLLETVNNLQRV